SSVTYTILLTSLSPLSSFFFLHAPAPPEIYTLSLHDALPISARAARAGQRPGASCDDRAARHGTRCDLSAADRRPHQLPRGLSPDRKSTRLNSSHVAISYAVFCLKKKKINDVVYAQIFVDKSN